MTLYDYKYRVEKKSGKYFIREYKVSYYSDYTKWEPLGLLRYDYSEYIFFETEEDACQYILNELE